ncbi:hypothetical protein Ciccas_012434 [Cichlidogyrus casuarinus]|uniref:Uncharacterized protein n=1 Tax=Cichlidogyrus casuarinus TaxID=1844966 RepID=A0ABD2PP42_9PLAT
MDELIESRYRACIMRSSGLYEIYNANPSELTLLSSDCLFTSVGDFQRQRHWRSAVATLICHWLGAVIRSCRLGGAD